MLLTCYDVIPVIEVRQILTQYFCNYKMACLIKAIIIFQNKNMFILSAFFFGEFIGPSKQISRECSHLVLIIHLSRLKQCEGFFQGHENEKWKCVIFKCYSSEELITLNTLHEVVPTWYSFHSWVDWSNADKVSCSRRKHIDAEVRTLDLCIQNRHSNHYANCFNVENWTRLSGSLKVWRSTLTTAPVN